MRQEVDLSQDAITRLGTPQFSAVESAAFARGLGALNDAGIPYLVAGALAKHAYTGIWRPTKDIDIFLKGEDLEQAMKTLAEAGFETELVFQHWLAKATSGPHMIDLIFGLGHGRLRVDESWFTNRRPVQVVGIDACLVPPEEFIASKAYIAERFRFDGEDILHIILQAAGQLDWERILALLGPHRPLLLWYLLLFDFVYPGHATYLPQGLMAQLCDEMKDRWRDAGLPNVSRGTLLDPWSFAVDVDEWGFEDRRDLDPLVSEAGEVL